MTRQSVRNLARRYQQGGLERALYDKQRPGAACLLSNQQRQRIIAMVCSDPPRGRARWTVRLVAQEAVQRRLLPRVGRETIRLLLLRHDLKPWRKKCGASRSGLTSTSRAGKMCWKHTRGPIIRRIPLSASTRSRSRCTPTFAPRGPPGRDARLVTTANTNAAEPRMSSAPVLPHPNSGCSSNSPGVVHDSSRQFGPSLTVQSWVRVAARFALAAKSRVSSPPEGRITPIRRSTSQFDHQPLLVQSRQILCNGEGLIQPLHVVV